MKTQKLATSSPTFEALLENTVSVTQLAHKQNYLTAKTTKLLGAKDMRIKKAMIRDVGDRALVQGWERLQATMKRQYRTKDWAGLLKSFETALTVQRLLPAHQTVSLSFLVSLLPSELAAEFVAEFIARYETEQEKSA